MKKESVREQVRSYVIITLACVLYALSFNWFYAPNDFTVGGFTGISQIINFFIPVLPVGVMIIVLNVPLFIVGLKKFGFAFLVKSIYTMALSSVLIDVVDVIHQFSPMDPLLACLYGGVTLGVASGLIFREEATTGGSELGAWIVRSHVERLSIGNICLGIDLTIILIYAAVFRSLNNALYGALALYITTKVLDLVVYGQNTAKLAYIISDKYEEIMQEMIARDMGATLLNGKGIYTGSERPLLLCAVRNKEVVSIKRFIKELDPDAFFIVCDASEVLGEGFGVYNPKGL
jgi:uncharacterized membrane-anchored protein YitT (DUF2179 family)